MIAAVLCENGDFSKIRRFNDKSVSEFDMRIIFKSDADSSF